MGNRCTPPESRFSGRWFSSGGKGYTALQSFLLSLPAQVLHICEGVGSRTHSYQFPDLHVAAGFRVSRQGLPKNLQ